MTRNNDLTMLAKQELAAAEESAKRASEVQLKQARQKAECLISARDRSETELRKRLERAGFEKSIVDQVIDEVLAVGLVDDKRFIQLYLAGKKRGGWGRVRIEQELRRYGIELHRCEGYPEEFFSEEDELERARACLEGFHSSAKNQEAARYRHLMTKGFSAETTWKALRL
jgi:regulatory protein